MEVPTVIITLGSLIFFSHIFNELFDRTKIPNVFVLLLIGILLGPVSGLISIDYFGEFGSVFTIIALIVILFESGTSLKFAEIKQSIGSALLITLINFFLSAGIATVVAYYCTNLEWIHAIFVGAIIGGTSAAVVIPMVRQLRLCDKSRTTLFLESALSDVLCLVIGLAVLEGLKLGAIDISGVLQKMWKAFLFAALIGIAGGFIWSIIFRFLRTIENTMFTSLAFVFILYGLVELMELNGGIAVLCFGIILGNSKSINQSSVFKKIFAFSTAQLRLRDKNFFSEIVFIVQTYFFVYVGISIQIGNINNYLFGLLIVTLIIATRPLIIKVFTKKKSVRDVAVMSVMMPKGLVPAVLASIPFQLVRDKKIDPSILSLNNSLIIQDLGYSIVLFSILVCSVMVIIIGFRLKDKATDSEVSEQGENIDEAPENNASNTEEKSNNEIIDDL